jgi:hypothetical protein
MLKKPPVGAECNACGLCCRLIVCSTGSFALGLVDRWGERAAGPCPALNHHEDGRQTCGLVERPKDWMPDHPKSVTALREAVRLLIGSGAGCDEPDDVEDQAEVALTRRLGEAYIARKGLPALQRAAHLLMEG